MENEKRLIDAKHLMQNGWHLVQTGESNRFIQSMSLADIPTVDAVEVVHAEWLDGYGVCDNKKSYISIDCSNCGEYFKLPSIDENIEEWKKRFAYCPFCGAKMDGGNEDG